MEDNNNNDRKAKMKEKFSELKGNIETFISDIKVDDLKKSFSMMVKEAQKEFNQLVDRDLEVMKKKLQEEKVEIEKKAKVFLEAQKKELRMVQEKLDQLMKKASKKAPASKKTTKKASAAKGSKEATKKKTTRKA